MKNKCFKSSITIVLILIFIAPGVSAYFFYTHQQLLSKNTTNHGHLLKLPIQISEPSLAGKWQVLVWNEDGCGSHCQQQLDQLARARLALGRRLYDLGLTVLIAGESGEMAENVSNILQEQDITVLKWRASQKEALPLLTNSDEIYIQDPKGYIVLSYSATAAPQDIFHDIKILLKSKE